MHNANDPSRPLFLAAFAAVFTLAFAPVLHAGQAEGPVTVVVVRHAEKADDGTRDPDLTEAGRKRACALVDVLAETEIAAIYTTQYRRTRATAEPLAADRDLEIQVREITGENMATWFDSMVAEIHRDHAGRTVVMVGHSNTVPRIVEVMTGRDAEAMSEREYDRLIVVTSERPGSGRFLTARYGRPMPP